MSLLTGKANDVAQRVIAEEESRRRHIVVALSGAHAYGFPSPDSDLDMKAIHIEPTKNLLGLSPTKVAFDRLEFIDGVEIDYTSNEISGVLSGILAGNGNYIERVLGAILLGGMGVIAGILAQKFDQMAAITNFVITPLAFLSGTFYSIERLPEGLQSIIYLNPVFYLIDGVRYGFIGTSDSDPMLGLMVCLLSCAAVTGLCWRWFSTGYRLKP